MTVLQLLGTLAAPLLVFAVFGAVVEILTGFEASRELWKEGIAQARRSARQDASPTGAEAPLPPEIQPK